MQLYTLECNHIQSSAFPPTHKHSPNVLTPYHWKCLWFHCTIQCTDVQFLCFLCFYFVCAKAKLRTVVNNCRCIYVFDLLVWIVVCLSHNYPPLACVWKKISMTGLLFPEQDNLINQVTWCQIKNFWGNIIMILSLCLSVAMIVLFLRHAKANYYN